MKIPNLLLTVFALLGVSLTAQAQHSHINVGAYNIDPYGAQQGDPLYVANGSLFNTESGYIKELVFATSGAYAGYFEGNITFTALASSLANGGPSAYHAANGSYIEMRLVSVLGPAGGIFSLWESGAVSPTFSLGAGQSPISTLGWNLSESDGSAGSDPFGHVHGRRFTADTHGLYTVTFEFVDISTLGPDGTPVHPTPTTITMYFNAVPEPATLMLVLAGLAGVICRRRKSSSC